MPISYHISVQKKHHHQDIKCEIIIWAFNLYFDFEQFEILLVQGPIHLRFCHIRIRASSSSTQMSSLIFSFLTGVDSYVQLHIISVQVGVFLLCLFCERINCTDSRRQGLYWMCKQMQHLLVKVLTGQV